MPLGQTRQDASKMFLGRGWKAVLALLLRRLSLRSAPSNDASVMIEHQAFFMTRTVISALDLVAAQAIIAEPPPARIFIPRRLPLCFRLYALRADRSAPASPKMGISVGRKAIVCYESIVLCMHQNAPQF